MNYINVLYVPILIWDHNNFAFVRSDLVRLVGAPNDSLRVIIIYYSFKYSFRIKISLLEPLRSQKNLFKSSI